MSAATAWFALGMLNFALWLLGGMDDLVFVVGFWACVIMRKLSEQ